MNLELVAKILFSCILNAVIAATVDYYASALLKRRDVFKTGRAPKIFTVQWLAFTLMLCGFAHFPTDVGRLGMLALIGGKTACYIVLFELLYEGNFFKKLLMAAIHPVIMFGGELIMNRVIVAAGLNPAEYYQANGWVQHLVTLFISMPVVAAGLAMRRAPKMWFGSITNVQKLKLALLPILSSVMMIMFLLVAFNIVPVVSTVSAMLILIALLTILSIGFQLRFLSNMSVAQKQMTENEEKDRQAQFDLQLGVQQTNHAEDVHRIEQDMRANIRTLRELNAAGRRDEIETLIGSITDVMTQNRVEIPLSGVSVIDGIMWAKVSSMKKKGIEADYATEKLNAESITIPDAELCALLANALDNAVEGTQRVNNGEKKKIFVRIRQTEYALEITVRNRCEAEQTVAKAFMQSAKRAIGSHGYGMGNMQRICRDNGGNFAPDVQNGVFTVFISLPCRNETAVEEGAEPLRENAAAAG